MKLISFRTPISGSKSLKFSILSAGLLFGISLSETFGVYSAPKYTYQFKTPTTQRFELVTPLAGLDGALSSPWMSGASSALTPGLISGGSELALKSSSGSDRILHPASRWVLAVADNEAYSISDLLDQAPWPGESLEEMFPGVWIIQQGNVWEALENANFFSSQDAALAAYPIWKDDSLNSRGSKYAPAPNDPLFVSHQWNLDNRNSDRQQLAGGLNVRAAWPVTRGQGVRIAIADEGVEMNHPDLKDRTNDELSFNFVTGRPNGNPSSSFLDHGTAVAGLAAATANNEIGVAGVAPESELVSWNIVESSGFYADSDVIARMFQSQIQEVHVQNHSWGPSTYELSGPFLLERMSISNAVHNGRLGKGVIMVRAGGNEREEAFNVNQDGYANAPEIIAVGATTRNGRVTSYSTPGASLLVATPGGEFNQDQIATTDRQGFLGINNESTEAGNYLTSDFVGTSGSAPQVAGLVALMLSVRPELSYRDVQQILALASRIVDRGDPETSINGAGLEVSHNVGYGIPDAGLAVELAKRWELRPENVELVLNQSSGSVIPDAGLVLETRRQDGSAIPGVASTIVAASNDGLYPPKETSWVAFKDIGLGNSIPFVNLAGQAALIQRGILLFSEKIEAAESFGAEFSIIFDNVDQQNLVNIFGANRAFIPTVFISKTDGDSLRGALKEFDDLEVRIRAIAAEIHWDIEDSLSTEFVGVSLRASSVLRSELRVEVISPKGTVSVLQTRNFDDTFGDLEWTYFSARHFYENCKGRWTLRVIDEVPVDEGTLTGASLIIRGVPIVDQDMDGLSDSWEQSRFGNLNGLPTGDPDSDGYSNLLEWLLDSDPNDLPTPLRVGIQLFEEDSFRLSWPSEHGDIYELDRSTNPLGPFTQPQQILGRFPETEWIVPAAKSSATEWFKVTQKASQQQ